MTDRDWTEPDGVIRGRDGSVMDYQTRSEFSRLKHADIENSKRIAELISTTAALRSELAQYRELPLVPAQEHQRVCEQRDHALRQLDSTTAEIARLRDRRDSQALKQALDMLQAVMGTLNKEADDRQHEWIRDGARAFLVEQGREAPEVVARREQYEEMQRRHAARDGEP